MVSVTGIKILSACSWPDIRTAGEAMQPEINMVNQRIFKIKINTNVIKQTDLIRVIPFLRRYDFYSGSSKKELVERIGMVCKKVHIFAPVEAMVSIRRSEYEQFLSQQEERRPLNHR
jgi:hypothetical protein